MVFKVFFLKKNLDHLLAVIWNDFGTISGENEVIVKSNKLAMPMLFLLTTTETYSLLFPKWGTAAREGIKQLV